MNWGRWIVVAFLAFAMFIGVLVVISMRQDVNLVAHDYYQKELQYQDQIERLNNTNQLRVKPSIQLHEGIYMNIYFPNMVVEEGSVQLFRPSDATLDQRFALRSTADSIQQFKVRPLDKGMYKIKLEWKMDGKEYFLEEIISM
jgi:hypothetical protein